MSLETNGLSATECDVLTETFTSEKDQLVRRKRNYSESLESKEKATEEISAEIASTQAIINGYSNALAVITDERTKRDLELKIEREETRLKSLENRQANNSAVTLVERQMDIDMLDAQIPILEAGIAAIEAHKATLS